MLLNRKIVKDLRSILDDALNDNESLKEFIVEIGSAIEGLVHMSEMDWTNKNIHPSKVVKVGQEVEVMVLDLNPDKRRVSLGIKQCIANPWDVFKASFKEGDEVSGPIK